MKKVYVLFLMIFGGKLANAQQVIGSFPTMDGGFESQVAGNLTSTAIATGVQRVDWTVQSTTGTRLITATGGRSGPKYVTYGTTTATARRLQSPTAGDALVVNTTAYTIQYFYRTAGATAAANGQAGASPDGTGSPGTYVATALAGTSGVWTKSTTSITSGNSAASPKYGVGVIRFNGISNVDIDVDDFVMYAGAVDNTAPNSAGTVTVNNPTGNSLDVSWAAAPGGVDGGGYVVVRYGALPGATDDPLQNGIYAVNNSVAGGVAGTVVYVGTGLSFTDAGLAGGTTYYYKIYTVDKAFNYAAESEGNGTTTSAVPDIQLLEPSPVAAGNIVQGTNNNVIYSFDLAVTTASATLNGVSFTTTGAYTATDISNFKCWYSADNIFNSGSDVLLSTLSPVGTAGTQAFPSFTSQLIAVNTTGYIFITADVNCIAVVGNDIKGGITTAQLSFVSGNKSGTAPDGGVQTISAATPNDVTAPAATIANNSSSLSWTNPTGCYDEIMIVGATASNTGTPTGNGSAYTANATYGSGTALGNGFVLYKGSTSPQTVNGLTNGTPYFYKFFTRFGTTWSAGIEISQTPAAVSSPTDYFRSIASGAWNVNTTWESSNDSTNWYPATLFPGVLASHVVIQNSDSVWLDASRSTPNLTLLSNAKMNALTFTMTVTSRFNLLNTSAFYQGGTVQGVPGFGVQQVLSTTSNYHFNGTQAGTANTVYPAFGNLYWEPTPATNGTFQNSVSLAPFNLGLVVRGNMTINIQGGTPREIRFATGTSVTRHHTIDGNLNIISSSSVVVITNGGLPVYASVTVGGNINISAGILQGTSSSAATDGSSSLNLLGNINNTGGTIQTGNSTAGIFSLNYVGTGAQNINNTGGTITFTSNQLDSINKPAGVLTLNTPVTHAGTIRFISGIVNTTAANLLTLTASAAVSNASNASYVSGPVKKIGNTAFTFPVGKANGYVPIGVSNFTGLSAPTDEFTAEYIRASGAALGPNTAIPAVNRISACEYWTLNLNNGTPTVDLTLYWNANNPCNGTYITNVADMEIVHFNGAAWNTSSVGFSSKNGTPAAGDVTWTNVSVFSPFTLASSTNNNPLPITINYFNGTRSNGNHLLNWKVTCVSTPSTTIEMERSTDGRNYGSIYSIFATAIRCQQPFNYTDAQPAKGVNYYRLKMTDADGKITYSTVVTLINAVKGIDVMNIAPNPIVNGTFNLKISAAEKTPIELVITDMQGRVLQKQHVAMIAGFNTIPMNVKSLAAGTYQLFGNTADGRTRVLRFVIQ